MAAPTDTPRTDAAEHKHGRDGYSYLTVDVEFARTLERELSAALAEVKRLNEWADGMTDAALKERQTGEMYQRELRAEIERLRQQQDELARRAGLAMWGVGACLNKPDTSAIIARVRAEMEKEKGNG